MDSLRGGGVSHRESLAVSSAGQGSQILIRFGKGRRAGCRPRCRLNVCVGEGRV